MPLNPGLQNQVETAAAGWRSNVLWLEPLRIFLSSESRAGLRPFGLWRRAGTFPLWLMKRPIHQPGPETFPPDREADAAPDGGLKGTRCSPRRPLFKSTQTRFSFSTVTNVQAAWRKLCVCLFNNLLFNLSSFVSLLCFLSLSKSIMILRLLRNDCG